MIKNKETCSKRWTDMLIVQSKISQTMIEEENIVELFIQDLFKKYSNDINIAQKNRRHFIRNKRSINSLHKRNSKKKLFQKKKYG